MVFYRGKNVVFFTTILLKPNRNRTKEMAWRVLYKKIYLFFYLLAWCGIMGLYKASCGKLAKTCKKLKKRRCVGVKKRKKRNYIKT